MDLKPLNYSQLDKQQIPLVNQFYKRVYKKGVANKADQVFVLQDTKIRCAARLKAIDELLLLTGVACEPERQGNGLASLLINKVLSTQQQDVYCFPYIHLGEFYQALGFTLCHIEQLPDAVATRYQKYNRHNTLLCMVYASNSDSSSP